MELSHSKTCHYPHKESKQLVQCQNQHHLTNTKRGVVSEAGTAAREELQEQEKRATATAAATATTAAATNNSNNSNSNKQQQTATNSNKQQQHLLPQIYLHPPTVKRPALSPMHTANWCANKSLASCNAFTNVLECPNPIIPSATCS